MLGVHIIEDSVNHTYSFRHMKVLDKLSGAAKTTRGKDAIRNINILSRKNASTDQKKGNIAGRNSPEQSTVYSADFKDRQSDLEGGGSDSESGTNAPNSPSMTTSDRSNNKKLAAKVESRSSCPFCFIRDILLSPVLYSLRLFHLLQRKSVKTSKVCLQKLYRLTMVDLISLLQRKGERYEIAF